ncbi:pisatin demethylase [Fusarium phyllophilum]|uniref:Pisatin demethylase n=1 Tax=Fusarium phyllophilum TaxID=47803 RepID=A0A8H5MXP7_9HYPO|nr:pisatin demethylase [Fusarium phyllophilum]
MWLLNLSLVRVVTLVILALCLHFIIRTVLRPSFSDLRHLPGPNACREVLQTNAYRFAKPAFFHTLVGEFLGVGLLFSVGDQHKRLRRITAGPLSRPSIRKLFPTFLTYSHKLNSDIDAVMQQSSNSVLELEDLFTRVTLDIIGVSLVATCWPDNQLHQSLHPTANLNFIKAKSALRSMMTELIEQRTSEVAKAKELATGSGLSDDLLTRMIEAGSVENQRLSRDELIDITMQVIVAGHETTASALLWTTYALFRDQKSQDQLRAQILTLIATEMTAKSIDELPYLDNVIREAFRVYSPTLIIPWEALEDVDIAGVRVPKGTTVQLVPAMTQLNPEIWGLDVETFNPDRWDRLSGDALSPYAMETFSNGPRMCPGKALALFNMKVLLVWLIRDFKIESVGDEEVEFRNPSLTLKSKKPLRFKVQRVGEGS